MNQDASETSLKKGILGMNAKEFGLVNFGIILVAAGVYFFKYPNNFSMGGVSGISVILSALIPDISTATISAIINMALLALGFAVFGRNFGARTAYATTVLSLEVWLLEYFFPMAEPFTDLPLLEMLYAIALPAVGAAFLFNTHASTGGTDIIAMIVKKHSSLDIGKALMASDLVITLLCFPVFGSKTGLLSLMGLLTKGLIVDSFIESLNQVKYFTIITVHGEEVGKYVTAKLRRGATIFKAKGVYSDLEKSVIITAVDRVQAVQLRDYVKAIDKKAFILITNTSQIIGKGFHSAF